MSVRWMNMGASVANRFAARWSPADVEVLTRVPGAGTVITIRGVVQGDPFKEPEFYAALLRLWLGPNPADWKLKDALLGHPA
jgi:hypothetical protein